MWDFEKCRALLLSLDADDLRNRLGSSGWNRKIPMGVNWMKEAAAAFGVPLYQKRVQNNGRKSSSLRRMQYIIDDVLRAIAQANACVPGSAAERDERRRQARLADMLQLNDVYRARSEIPLLAAATMDGTEQLREDVLLYECPEDLRIAVTCECRQGAQT